MSQPDQVSPEPPASYLVNHQWAHPNLFYNYQKLDTPSSFRLLQIERQPEPDDTYAPCHYSMIQTTIDQAPPYETLSYVWGTTDRSEMVTLKNGKLLRTTKLLKEAFVYVERQCSTGYLWIDQICIDQDDRNERGHQVKLMGRIYTSCFRVLVWLGRLAAFEVGLSFADHLEQSRSSKHNLVPRRPRMIHLKYRVRKVIGSGNSSTGNSFIEVLQVPWFQRAWVFQEIVLSPSALFILATMSTLPHLARTMSLWELHTLVNLQARGIDGFNAVVNTIDTMHLRCRQQRRKDILSPPPIEQTLSLLAPTAKTSEELDRLYAFFGLNSDTCINLTPSYGSSLEVAMINTTISIIEGTCSLDIFEVIPRATESTIDNVGIPTWTPDFRERHLVIPFERSNADFRRLAKSSPKLYPQFIPTQTTYYRGTIYCAGEEERMIQAHGFVLDQVDTEIGSLSSSWKTIADNLYAMLNRCIEAWNDIKWSLEHKSSWRSRHKREGTGLAEFAVDLGLAPIPTMQRLQHALKADGCCILVSPYIQPDMMQVMRGRTLWMTRSGRFALGSYLRCGDHICLAYGCSNPIALRGEREMTRVLGTCFLEGWMDPWSNGNIARAEKEFACTVFNII